MFLHSLSLFFFGEEVISLVTYQPRDKRTGRANPSRNHPRRAQMCQLTGGEFIALTAGGPVFIKNQLGASNCAQREGLDNSLLLYSNSRGTGIISCNTIFKLLLLLQLYSSLLFFLSMKSSRLSLSLSQQNVVW